MFFAVGILIAGRSPRTLGLFQVIGGVEQTSSRRDPGWFRRCQVIGSRRGGLVFAWLAHFAAYASFTRLGATRPISSHSLAGKLAFLFDPVGVAILAVATLIIGTVGFGLGYLQPVSINRIKNNSPMNSQQ